MSGPHAVVLGVAQDGGHPQPGCQLACCVGKGMQPHLTTCVALVGDGAGWLLDAGPDFPGHLARLNADGIALAGILLTHAHIGHYTGLMYLGREAMGTQSMPVWAAPRLAAFLRSNGPWQQLAANHNIELRTIELGHSIQLMTDLSVDAFAVPHRGEYSETVGFVVQGPQRSLLYVPDTDGWDEWQPPVEDRIRRVDIAMLDATFFSPGELPGRDIRQIAHPFVTDSLARFSELEERDRAKIRFTHLNHSNPLLYPDSNEFVRVARFGAAVAAEGDVYPL